MASEKNDFGPLEGQLESVRDRLIDMHEGEEIEYATCCQNGCFDMCLLKCHKKDGVLTAIETDNIIHPNCGREDAYYDEEEFYSAMFQHRACVRGRGWRKDVYSPTRIKYPMRAVGPKGSRKFKRITWDEALDEIAQRYVETREKYGPMSVYSEGMMSGSMDYIGQFMPGGALSCWGADSFEPHDFADTYQFGQSLLLSNGFSGAGGTEAQTFLDAKAIVLWGVDIFLNYPEHVFYLNMAREKGIPVIYIDPRYTWTAHLADQWIPIRPSTDAAMIEAMAYTIFEEGLENTEFIEKYVEEGGIDRWKEVLYGLWDGTMRTPEWAEKICGVPAQTIRELARLVADGPVYMRMVWAATRNVGGEDPARVDNYLRIITGNLGRPGCLGTGMAYGIEPHWPFPEQYLYGERFDKIEEHNVLEREAWFRAVLERERYEAGEISLADYKRIVGCPQFETEPNIKMIIMLTNPCNIACNYYDAGARLEALKKTPFVVYAAYDWTQTSTWYADLVLPLQHQFLEGGGGVSLLFQHYNVSNAGLSPSTSNYFIGMGRIIDFPGECRTKLWIMKEIAERVKIPGDPDGCVVADYYCPEIKGMSFEELDAHMEVKAEEKFNEWRELPEIAELEPPTWEEFKKVPYFIRPEKDHDYFIGLKRQLAGEEEFHTPSGKIEIVSHFVEDHNYHDLPYATKTYGKGEVKAVGSYSDVEISPLSPIVNDYPLYLITPHAFYRQHFCQDGNPWFRDEYRMSVWISAADAAKRGIKDGDMVMAHNQFGQCMLPAYVTSRLTPGISCMIFGRQYDPSSWKTDIMPDGIDRAGSSNFLVNSNEYNHRTGIDFCSGMIEITNLEGKGAYIDCEGEF